MAWVFAGLFAALGISGITALVIVSYSAAQRDDEIEQIILKKEKERRKLSKSPALDKKHHIPWTGV